MYHRNSICMLTQYAFSILFIDKKKAKFSNDRFGFKVEWNKGSRRRLFDLHVSFGWCALLWLLLLSVTGLGFGLKLVPKGSELMQLFHVIHIGSWGGMLTKIITFVISLIGASLPVTGYLLYFRRKYKS